MWQGVIPAVTTKFTESGELDFAEMARCYKLQMDAGCETVVLEAGDGAAVGHARSGPVR